MDDEDSGIFQSRTDTSSAGDVESICLDVTSLNYPVEPLTSEAHESDATSPPTSLSEDISGTDSSTDDEFVARVSEFSTRAKLEQVAPEESPVRKRLTITDPLSRGPGNVHASSSEFTPHMKTPCQANGRDEHWEFQDKLHSGPTQEAVISALEKTNQKRVLKLQLSVTSSASSNSGSVPSDSESDHVIEVDESGSTTKDVSLPKQESCASFFLELRDPNAIQCAEWNRVFRDCANILVSTENVLRGNLHYDALVLPGNSFGFLDGEPEIQYTLRFGWTLQENIQKTIEEEYDGELLVGQALITPIFETMSLGADPPSVRYAVYAPVMRVPLQVGNTVNAYLAFRAVLREVKLHNKRSRKEDVISTILCPSLCDGFGSMPPERIALQMRTAYDDFVTGSRMGHVMPEDLGPLATKHVEMTTKFRKTF